MSNATSPSSGIIRATKKLSKQCAEIDFSEAAPWVYNPLDYAWDAHRQYLERFARQSCRVLFLGMNPGPWGMAQIGIPFGEIAAARDYLQLDGKITRPKLEHPKRPIQGWDCPRSEVSGRRLWGLFSEQYPSADDFFDQHFVTNYCPLVFMEESARNVTPDKLPGALRLSLESHCDAHLLKVIQLLEPEWIVGVGGFAEKCATRVCQANDLENLTIGRILHPSPASPAANKDWSGTATHQLQELKIWS